MAENKTIKSSLPNMVLVLVLVAGLSALVLGYVYEQTHKPIAESKDNRELEAISEIIPGGFDNNPFEEKTVITTSDNQSRLEMYPVRNKGVITALAIKSYTNKAFGGRMEIMVGITLDGKLSGYKVIDHKETPGLGTKVMEEGFSRQFIGLNPDKVDFRVKQDGGDIDAVTAATISSRAVVDAIQRAFDAYNKFSAGI